jgi:hypothetical protein
MKPQRIKCGWIITLMQDATTHIIDGIIYVLLFFLFRKKISFNSRRKETSKNR